MAKTSELVATPTLSPKLLEALTDRVQLFCEGMCGVTLYDYQREFTKRVIRSVLANDGAEITALFSRQSGKTEGIAVVVCGLLVILPILASEFPALSQFSEGFHVGIYAPAGDQVETTYARALARMKSHDASLVLSDPEVREDLVGTGRHLMLTNGSFVRGQSAAKQTNIESKTYHLVIVEEAQDVDTLKVRKSIHPMLTATNGTMVKIGTANPKKSDFHDAVKRNRALEAAGKGVNGFEFDYKRVIKDKAKQFKADGKVFHTYYAKFIAAEKDRIGEDSDEFRMSYCLEFILERGLFITEPAFDSVLDKKREAGMELWQKHDHWPLVFGLDIGKDDAHTILTIGCVDFDHPDEQGRCTKYVLDWHELASDTYESQFFELTDILQQWPFTRGVCDATGVGDAIADRLVAHFVQDVFITPFKFSSKTKSGIYISLDQEIKGQRISIPAHANTRRTQRYKRFRHQMLSLEKSWRGAFLDCHKPQEKWAYDDYPDSLALMNFAAEDEALAEVQCSMQRMTGRKAVRGGAYW